jgi:thiol-disulfide isomerase/thioredoxin
MKFLYFTAPWCAPCKTFGPVWEEVSAQYGKHILFEKYDIDTEEGRKLAAIYSVRTVPAIFFEKPGEPTTPVERGAFRTFVKDISAKL